MTKKERELLEKIEATECKEDSGKYNYKALNIYMKLLKQIMEKDYFHIQSCLDKLENIKQICQDVEKEYTAWRNLRKVENKEPCLYNATDIEFMQSTYWACVKQRSYWVFEDFIIFMERRRDPLKRFYEPRKCTLKAIVDDLQELEFSKTQKFYGLSMPSRVGKSTICILFLCWVAFRKPNSHSAMGGHSGALVKGFYKELLNFMTSPEYEFETLYRWHHPEYANSAIITDRSAEDYTITLGDRDRFATITCRSCDATWTGAIDISGGDNKTCGYLYVDDLVRDREHSLNPVRMENTFQEYLNKMVDRKNDGAKELMVGTLWNIYDPLCRLKDKYNNNQDYVFKRIPALDEETDESNFNYKINGFSTDYYRDMRERLDANEWQSKFMQSPQIREGILFSRESMHRFMVIPTDGTTVAYCDPALGGGDFVSMPIARFVEGENKRKIIDWVYDPSSVKVTVPKVVDKIIKWHISRLVLEIDGGAGTLFHKELQDEIAKRDCGWCEVVPKHSSTRLSKDEKIKGRSDYIKDNFEFLEDISPDMTPEYKKAFNDTCIYTTVGKNVHDDAPDSLAGLALDFRPFTENGIVYVPDINPFRTYGGIIY